MLKVSLKRETNRSLDYERYVNFIDTNFTARLNNNYIKYNLIKELYRFIKSRKKIIFWKM